MGFIRKTFNGIRKLLKAILWCIKIATLLCAVFLSCKTYTDIIVNNKVSGTVANVVFNIAITWIVAILIVMVIDVLVHKLNSNKEENFYY